MSLINQMSLDKPDHLKDFDRRFVNEGNVFSTGNMLYSKNSFIAPDKDRAGSVRSPSSLHVSQEAPGSSPQKKKYGIRVENSFAGQTDPAHREMKDESCSPQNQRKNVLTKNAKAQAYARDVSESPEASPDGESSRHQRASENGAPSYPQYAHYGSQQDSEEP